MKEPLILVDGLDVQFFASAADLERYVESPDVDAYRAYDSAGTRLRLIALKLSNDSSLVAHITGVRVETDVPPVQVTEELRQVLSLEAARVGIDDSALSIESLVSALVACTGYQK